MLHAQALGEILLALCFSWARMGLALILSLAFSIVVGILAGISRVAERIIIPILDVLQSIPILSFFPLALYAFVGLHPVIGSELAAIFLIFTSQVWNIAFGVYEAVKLLPSEIIEASRALNLDPIRRLFMLYTPAAFPRIAANLPASWSNSLYFLVACEIISIGEIKVKLFGIGSLSADYILAGRYLEFWTSLAMVIVAVILMNLFIFIPLMKLGERYRFEAYVREAPRVWIERATKPFSEIIKRAFIEASIPGYSALSSSLSSLNEKIRGYKIHMVVVSSIIGLAVLLYHIPSLLDLSSLIEFLNGFTRLGVVEPMIMIFFSFLRVIAAVAITLAWAIPLSILVFRGKVLEKVVLTAFQVFASLPSTLLIPFIMRLISSLGLPIELGGLIVIVFGIQWYLFFFLYGAMRAIPSEELEICEVLGIKGFRRFKHLYFPRLFPSMITGCMVAVGGGWNTLIVVERLVLDHMVLEVENPGIGKVISLAIGLDDMPMLAAATIWMAGFIVILNRLFWRRLHVRAMKALVTA